MPFNVGPMELVILLVLVLIIFGAGRLPKVGEAMGKSIRDFRKGLKAGDEDEAPERDMAPKEQ